MKYFLIISLILLQGCATVNQDGIKHINGNEKKPSLFDSLGKWAKQNDINIVMVR